MCFNNNNNNNNNNNTVGWVGFISREEAEQKLKDKHPGTYLIRWSNNANSYVLSYRLKNSIQNVAFIKLQQDGGYKFKIKISFLFEKKKKNFCLF